MLSNLIVGAMINKTLFLLFVSIMAISYSCVKPPETIQSDVVINELLPINRSTAPDQYGEYDDWIELYNLSGSAIDISGYFLSDDNDQYTKWEIPSGTTIQGNGFLIIWADGDSTQVGLHTNFKLSSLGEDVLLSSPDGTLLDEITYPAQTIELSYSRNPDGTGKLLWQTPTYNRSNNLSK